MFIASGCFTKLWSTPICFSAGLAQATPVPALVKPSVADFTQVWVTSLLPGLPSSGTAGQVNHVTGDILTALDRVLLRYAVPYVDDCAFNGRSVICPRTYTWTSITILRLLGVGILLLVGTVPHEIPVATNQVQCSTYTFWHYFRRIPLSRHIILIERSTLSKIRYCGHLLIHIFLCLFPRGKLQNSALYVRSTECSTGTVRPLLYQVNGIVLQAASHKTRVG